MNPQAPKGATRQEVFLQSFRREIERNPVFRTTWLKAKQDGCTEVNLIGFLCAFCVAEELVMGPRRKSRKRVLSRLAALAKTLESAAIDAEQLLTSVWWKDETVSQLLTGVIIELEAEKASSIRDGIELPPISGRFRAKGTLRPDLIFELPEILRAASQL